MNLHSLSLKEVLSFFKVESSTGLSFNDILERQKIFGENSYGAEKKFQALTVFFQQFKNPLIYLLIFAALIAFFLKEIKDSVVILVVVFTNSILGLFQEFKADQSLRELNRITRVFIRVLRDKKEILIPSVELVPGDIFFIFSGDVIPADARIIEAHSAKVNEAILTGESISIEKNTQSRSNFIYAGTILLTGRIKAVVVSIGLDSEIGKIAQMTTQVKEPSTPLELKIKKFSNSLLIFSFFTFLLILFVGFAKSLPLSELLLIAVSQVVSLVPEGLPVAMTIASAIGVRRMVKKNAIIRKLSSVETLGSTTVICSDKTGTITQNKMKVLELLDSYLKPDFSDDLMQVGVLCNDAVLVGDADLGDPTETAILRKAKDFGIEKEKLETVFRRTNEIPFSSENKFMMTEHRDAEGNIFLALKGSVDQILAFSNLDSFEKENILRDSSAMSSRGLRVLGFAKLINHSLEEGSDHLLKKFKFLGLMGQMDPPREGVSEAIKDCVEAGISTIMITGDHKLTAISIGKMVGLYREGDYAVDADELSNKEIDFSKLKIISRVRPEQKLEIVEKLQFQGHVVAMTGDGVNDAPAIAKADVGIAMGISGTEVTKQASKIILSDDDFSTIVEAVKEGRLVYKNIKKIILFLFSTSLSELIILVIALLMGLPAPFLAVQILWNNLVTEGVITVNLMMDPLEGNEMKHPPINKNEPLISPLMWKRMILFVPSIVFCTLGWFVFRLNSGVEVEMARTEAMTLLVLCEWFNVLNCRSEMNSSLSRDIFKNKWLVGGLLFGNLLHILVIFWRPLGDYFHTVPLDLKIIPILALVASFVLIVEELRKYSLKFK